MIARRHSVVLAFYPNARGFAFVVFEKPNALIDWGLSDVRRREKLASCLKRLTFLLDRYCPDTLIVRDMAHAGKRGTALFTALTAAAEGRAIQTVAISRKQIKDTLAPLGLRVRYSIAQAIIAQMPALAPLLPPVRKIWNGEDRRMGLFDAAALALTFLARQGQLARKAGWTFSIKKTD